MIIVTGTILAKPDTFDAMLKLSREHVERSARKMAAFARRAC